MLSLGSYFAAILSSNKSKAFQSKRMEFLPFFCKTSCHSNHCNKTFIAAIKQTTSKKVPKHFPHHKVHYIHPPIFFKHPLSTRCFFLKKSVPDSKGRVVSRFPVNPRIPPTPRQVACPKRRPKERLPKTTKKPWNASWVEGGWAPEIYLLVEDLSWGPSPKHGKTSEVREG